MMASKTAENAFFYFDPRKAFLSINKSCCEAVFATLECSAINNDEYILIVHCVTLILTEKSSKESIEKIKLDSLFKTNL